MAGEHDGLVRREPVHRRVAGERRRAPWRRDRDVRREASGDQQRQKVLRQRTRDRRRGLRIDGNGGEVDREREHAESGDERARTRLQERQAPQRNQRHEVAGADAEASLPSVEAEVEREEDDGDREDGALAHERNEREEQHRPEEEEAAIRRDRDAVQRFERRRSEDAHERALRDEARVGLRDAVGEEAAEAEPLVDGEERERHDGAADETQASSTSSRDAEDQQGRAADVVHAGRERRRESRDGVVPRRERDQHQRSARNDDHQQRRVRKKLRSERDDQRDRRCPQRRDAAAPRFSEEDRRNRGAEDADREQRAEIREHRQRERVVRRSEHRVNQGVRDRGEETERRRLVGVNVSVRERAVAGVVRVRVDLEGVALDDGAREIERRVLIPAGAGVEKRVHREADEEQPFGDSLVAEAHIARF